MSTWTCMNIKSQGHSLTLVQCHSVSTFWNFFYLETASQIEAIFHVELSLMGERKFVQIVQVTWQVWPPCPYIVKLKTFSSLEPKGRWPWKSVCSIGYSSTAKFIQMMTLGWPWHILRQGQIWSLMLLYGKRVKHWGFQGLLCFMMSKLVDAVN